MDARLTKQPIASQQLHTTTGLMAAKTATTSDNTVFIAAQCRIKTSSAKDQKNTDPGCGQWGKPWPKDAYMSGVFSTLFFKLAYFLIFFNSEEVLDDYLATLNVRWCSETGMALTMLVSLSINSLYASQVFIVTRLNSAGQETNSFFRGMLIDLLVRSIIGI